MANFAKITDVQFGSQGWLRVVGENQDGKPISVEIALVEISKMAPRLLDAVELLAVNGPDPPPIGMSVPVWVAHARLPHAHKGSGDNEPCLTFQTEAGTFHIHFAPADAIACGNDLLTIGVARTVAI